MREAYWGQVRGRTVQFNIDRVLCLLVLHSLRSLGTPGSGGQRAWTMSKFNSAAEHSVLCQVLTRLETCYQAVVAKEDMVAKVRGEVAVQCSTLQ